MSSDQAAALIARTDETLKTLEQEEIERLNAALEESYLQLEAELLRKYPNYTAEAQPGLLATQRGVLLANDLKESLILINPEREAEIEARFNRLLQTANKEGQTLGDELIELQQGDDFVKATATLPIEAVGFAAKDSVKRLKKHDQKFQEEASILIQQGLIQGWGAMRTAGELRQRLGVTKGRAEAIARTEIISAQDSATRQTYKANGIEYIIRIGTQDSRICGWCAARAGQVYPVDTPVVAHPNDRCFPSGTIVSAPEVLSSTTRHYSGQVVVIKTASGVELTATPNHPILTDQGWVAAGLLKHGSNVFRSINAERVAAAISPDKYQGPALIEEVAAAVGESSSVPPRSVKVAPEDFHGDGKGSQVCVVRSNGLLRDCVNSKLSQPNLQELLGGRDAHLFFLSGQSAFTTSTERAKSAFIMDVFDQFAPETSLLSGHVLTNQDISLSLTSDLNSSVYKNYSHNASTFTDTFSNGFNRLTFGVPLDNRIFEVVKPGTRAQGCFLPHQGVAFGLAPKLSSLFQVSSKSSWADSKLFSDNLSGQAFSIEASAVFKFSLPIFNPKQSSFFESASQSVGMNPEFLSSSLGILPSLVQLDRIVDVEFIHFSGHVYNLETVAGCYTANSIIVHNCYSAPFLPDAEQRNPQQSAWIRNHAADIQERAAEGINTGRTPFEVLAGVPAAVPVWTPKQGYLDKDVERKGQSWAIGGLALLALTRGQQPEQPVPTPEEQAENELLKALLVGAAIAGVSIGAYYLARARARGNYKRSAEMAEALADEFADLADIDLGEAEQITLAIGGFNNKQGQAGLEQAEDYQKFLKNHKVVGLENRFYETQYDTATQPVQKVSEIIAKTVDVTLIKGYNPDSVKMAAAAIAFHRKHGKYPNLIGYSGGGIVVREAHEILKAYGAKDFKSISVASPYLGFEELSADEHIDIMNSADIFANMPQLNGVKLQDSRAYASAVEAHEIKEGYLTNPEFEQVVSDFFAGNYNPDTQWDSLLRDIRRLNPRDRYRDGFKQSAKMAEDMIKDIELSDPGDQEQISFVAGGFAGKGGTTGEEYAPYFKELLQGHHTVGVLTPEFDLGDGLETDPFGTIAKNWLNVVKVAVVDGRNASAVRMAATAAAHYRKYGKPVNLIGYSGGGMVAAEAHEILKLMGVPVKTANVASPWFGYTDLTPDELITLVGEGDIFRGLPFQNRIDVPGIKNHWLDSYLNSPIVEFELNRHFTRAKKRDQDTATARSVEVVVDDEQPVTPTAATQQTEQPESGPKIIHQLADEDENDLIINLYPEIALLSGAEFKALPGRLQQKLLAARAAAKGLLTGRAEPAGLLPGQQVKGLLEGLQVRGLLTGVEIKGLLEGLKAKGLLTGQEVKGLLEGFEPKGLLEGLQIKGLLEGLEIKGLLEQVDVKGLLTGFEAKGLLTGQEVKGLLEGLKIKGQLPGRLDPKQLPATAESRYNRTLEAIYQEIAKDLGLEDDLKGLLKAELPKLQPVDFAVNLTPAELAAVDNRTAKELYKQAQSLERGQSRLAGFRVRQKLAEVAKSDLPMLPKLAAYRQAIFDEIKSISSPLSPNQPPGTSKPEDLQRFNFAGVQWYTPELKPTTPTLDLLRKFTELDLPDEVIQSVNTIYISKQKNAAEEFWRKKLKLPTGKVPATVNLQEGSITAYGTRTNIQDLMRQAGYLVAYRRFGQLEPPQGSEYRRAMAEGRTITPYGFGSDAADFADSVAQFFLDPDRLKRFNPQRYNALSRLLNYRHPEKPLQINEPAPDPRGTEIIENLRTRNQEINQGLQQQRETANATAQAQRSTKKVQTAVSKVKDADIQVNLENGLTRSRVQEEALDRLSQTVDDLEQRSAQILNPFNQPYFAEVPSRIKATQRQLKQVEKELAAIDKVAATSAKVRTNIAELEGILADLTTRKDSLKVSSEGRKLETAWSNLLGDLETAEQDLIGLPRSNERAQALRDLVRLRAAIKAQESNVGVNVASLHQSALSPRIQSLRQLADSLDELQSRSTSQKDRLTTLQNRLARLPQKVADLDGDLQARYNTVKSTKAAQGKLPERVTNYRALKEAYTGELAKRSQDSQQLADNYTVQRSAAVNSVQAAIESRLQTINDNLTVLAALQPGSVAWLVDSRNWDLSAMPADLAIVLARQPGKDRNEKLKNAADEVVRLLGQVKGSASIIDQRIAYVENLAQQALEQSQAERRKWEQLRDDLADEETLSDRQIKAFLSGEKPVRAIDVIRYGNQLENELDEFNRNFVEILLNQEGVDPRTIIDQSELYKRARDSFASETAQTRQAIGAEIEQALIILESLEQKIAREKDQPVVFEVNGKARTAAEIRAELDQAQQVVNELLKIRQAEIRATEQGYLDENRAAQRQAEAQAYEQRQAKLQVLRDELTEVNREIQRRREAAERGQKRGIATDRLEAQQRRILKDIAKLGQINEDEQTN